MPPSVAQTARIFEDPEPPTSPKKKSHKRGLSVSEVLRGRSKETDYTSKQVSSTSNHAHPSPLGERHINSPPQPRKIPLKDESDSRPTLHKKTGSATSFKGFFSGREKSNDGENKAKDDNAKPEKAKKSKSSTNLAGLLKKRSKKDLKLEEPREEVKPPSSPSKVTSPIWAQFATQPIEGEDGTRQYPDAIAKCQSLDSPSINPQNYSDQHPPGQGPVQSYFDIDSELRMPQRPYLEKRASRSSIFTEDLEEAPKSPRPMSVDLSLEPRPECSRQPSTLSTSSMPEPEPALPEKKERAKSRSRVMDAIASFNMKSKKEEQAEDSATTIDVQEVDTALENVMGKYDIPQNLRDHMRNLKPEVKAGLVKGDRIGSGSSHDEAQLSSRSTEIERPSSKEKENDGRRSRSRSRPRSRVFSMSKKSKDAVFKPEESTRSRSKSRPKTADTAGSRPLSMISNISTTSLASIPTNDSTSTPGDFIHYLREVQKPELVEVGKIHKLRILLRNESVQWTDIFVKKGGMDEMAQLLHRIMKIEWREEHEDNLLHETLLCMKALTTTSLAMQRLETMERDLFPALLKMLFDPERRGPAEFSTRAVVISLLFAYLSATLHESQKVHEKRTRAVIDLMRDATETDKQPLDFVSQMHTSRPYRTWCKEVTNVTKEVFWIFLHHMNVIPVVHPTSESEVFARAYFPAARAPHPAAPYVGGVEWEATQYLATHLDLLNGLIVSLPTQAERNQMREELRQSGFEKVMGINLRTCKEKFYGGVHEGLRSWVAAAKADDWPTAEDVRAGPPREARSKSPVKKRVEEPPQLNLNLNLNQRSDVPKVSTKPDDGWL